MSSNLPLSKQNAPFIPQNPQNRQENALLRREQNLNSQRRRHKIAEFADDGMSSEQIASRLGITKQRVNRIANRAGILIGKQGGTGRIGAWVPRRLIASIGDLANDAGCSRSALLGRVIEAVFADKAMAMRLLGKAALPVRGYRAGE